MDLSKGSVELDGELGASLTRILGGDDVAFRLESLHQQLQVARQQHRFFPKLMHRCFLKNLQRGKASQWVGLRKVNDLPKITWVLPYVKELNVIDKKASEGDPG